jgi:hypothetical protein
MRVHPFDDQPMHVGIERCDRHDDAQASHVGAHVDGQSRLQRDSITSSSSDVPAADLCAVEQTSRTIQRMNSGVIWREWHGENVPHSDDGASPAYAQIS